MINEFASRCCEWTFVIFFFYLLLLTSSSPSSIFSFFFFHSFDARSYLSIFHSRLIRIFNDPKWKSISHDASGLKIYYQSFVMRFAITCELWIIHLRVQFISCFFFFIRLRLILIVNICWMSTWTIWLSFVHLHHCCSALDWSTWLYRIPSYSSAHENFIYFSFFFGNKFVVLSLTHAHTHIMMNWINLFSNVAIYLNII